MISQVTSNEGGFNVGARRTLEKAQELAASEAGEALTWSARSDREWWGERASGNWMQVDRFEV